MNRNNWLIALAVLLLASAPQTKSAGAPSDPGLLLAMRGKSAGSLTFKPLGEATQPLVKIGKPTVIVAFASWCGACIDEMPQTLADYARFKDHVNFLGIDYTENETTARKLASKYHLTFPIESYIPKSYAAHPPAEIGKSVEKSLTMRVPGGKLTPDLMRAYQTALPKDMYSKLEEVARAQRSGSKAEFQAAEARTSVTIEDTSAKHVDTPSSSKSTTMDLPHMFVISANGTVAFVFEGYDAGSDPIVKALSHLGIH